MIIDYSLSIYFILEKTGKVKRKYIPDIAPTAPKVRLCPSMTLASHSTVPSMLRLEPTPAFVQPESCNVKIRSMILLYME